MLHHIQNYHSTGDPADIHKCSKSYKNSEILMYIATEVILQHVNVQNDDL